MCFYIDANISLVLRRILQENTKFTRRVSDCEEIVGLLTGDDVVGLGESNIYHKLVDFSIMEDLNRKVVIK